MKRVFYTPPKSEIIVMNVEAPILAGSTGADTGNVTEEADVIFHSAEGPKTNFWGQTED